MRFQGRAESIGPMGSVKNQIPGGADRLPMVGPGPGKGTRREDHVLLIVHDEFRTGYSLIGLLASRARLCFTGIASIKSGRAEEKELSSNGNCVFSSVSHRRGPPHYPCEFVSIRGLNSCYFLAMAKSQT